MTKIFGVEKFKSLLWAGSFTVFANYVVRLADAVIAGHLLGADAFAGINLVSPFLAIVSFVTGLFATGMATKYSMEMGRCETRRAHAYFIQAFWSVLILCGAVGVVFGSGGRWLIGFFGADPTISAHAASYFAAYAAVPVLEGLAALFLALCYADGDTRLASASYAVLVAVKFVASYLFVSCGFGTRGCALGSLVAEGATVLLLALHFCRATNSLRFVRHFSLRDTGRICAASFGDAAAFLCDGLLFLILNKFVVQTFGSQYLPVVGVAAVLWGFLVFFDGIGVAIQPIVTVYYGEENYGCVRTVLRAAIRWSVLEGVFLMALVGLFPKLALFLVGLDDPSLVGPCLTAARWMSAAFVALALAGLFNSYYMFIDKAYLAGAITFLCYLIMPVAASATFSLVGIEGVWAGLALGPLLGLLVTASIILPIVGRAAFPLLLPRTREAKLHVFNLTLTDREITDVSRRIGELPGVPMKAALLTEEVFEVVKERNAGRTVLGEATVDLNDGVRLTLRDDGTIFDITDADAQISSLRTFLVASMMQMHEGRLNLVTTGFNRNVFRF